MHRLGLYTLGILYILLSYTPAESSAAVSTTASPATALTDVATKTSASSLTASSKVSDPDDTTSRSTLRETHGPHTSALPFAFTHRPWTPEPPSSTPSFSPSRHAQSHHRLKTTTIVGIVLGAFAGLVLILTVGRCWWSWKKTPSRDRIAALMHRYNLEREMEDAAVQPLRARVRRPPPPPYRPPPPGYESVLPSSPPPAHLELPA